MNALSATVAAAPTTAAPDLAAVKARQRAAWSSGDYAVVGTTLQIVGESLCEALDLRAGASVLDVAAGNGNASLAAARRWCEVVSTDYVPALLERGRERAAAERLDIQFREADAEALPFDDGAFDVVVSTFGAMFAPNPRRVADEMLRVCRPGAGSAWPTGRLTASSASCSRPSAATCPAGGSGVAGAVGHARAHRRAVRRACRRHRRQHAPLCFRYRSPAHWLDVFRSCYGPVLKAFAALDESAQAALAERTARADGPLQPR